MGLLSLAARNLNRRRRRTLFSGGALALGVAAVLLLRGATGGIQRLNTSMLVDGLLGAVQVHRAGYLAAADLHPLSLDFDDSAALRARVLAVPGVKAVAPRIVFGALLAPPGDGEAAPVTATAVEPSLERVVGWRRAGWASTWFGDGAEAAVLLDAEFADALGVAPQPAGLPVEALTGLLANDRDDALAAEPVRFLGTLANGLPGDKRVALVPLALAQRLLHMEGRVTEYSVAVHRLEEVPRVSAALAAALGPDFEVHAWDVRAPFLRDIEQGQDVFGALLGLIVLSVVVLGIANALLMNAMERVTEVGTMLALGARRAFIVRLFLVEGLLLSSAGTAAGLALGHLALAFWAGHPLPVNTPGTTLLQPLFPLLSLPWAVATALASLGAAGAVSLWAARRAAGLSPAEALRDP